MSGERVLITGAGGFVGRSLAQGLSRLGWHVIAVDRSPPEPWVEGVVEWISADLGQGGVDALPPADVVIHAAWVTTPAGELGVEPATHVGMNLRPLLAVLDYAARTQPGAFVFLSSSGVFAPDDGGDGLRDSDAPTATHPYSLAKRSGELLADALERPTEGWVVRLGYLYGPDETSRPSRSIVSPVAAWLAAAREGRPLDVGSADPRRDWTFTPDLAEALALLVRGPAAPGVVHLASRYMEHDSEMVRLIQGLVPGTTTREVPDPVQPKPPMVASDLPSIRDFQWTGPSAGLEQILSPSVTA